MDASAEPPPEGGLKGALARLGASLAGALHTRAELASVELVIERERLLLRLALVVGGVVALAFAMLFAGAFVIVLFWDSHRLRAIAGVALVHAIAGAVLVGKARAIGRDGHMPFAGTLAELDKDRARLSGALKPDA